jgi:hypothetical protein
MSDDELESYTELVAAVKRTKTIRNSDSHRGSERNSRPSLVSRGISRRNSSNIVEVRCYKTLSVTNRSFCSVGTSEIAGLQGM